MLDKSSLQLRQCHVALLDNQFPKEAAGRFDPARMPVTIAGLGYSSAIVQRKSSAVDCT